MDKKIKQLCGNVYFGEDFDKLIFNYILENPKITAKNLADVRLIKKKKKYISMTEGKIASPFVAQMYIDAVKIKSKTFK